MHWKIYIIKFHMELVQGLLDDVFRSHPLSSHVGKMIYHLTFEINIDVGTISRGYSFENFLTLFSWHPPI